MVCWGRLKLFRSSHLIPHPPPPGFSKNLSDSWLAKGRWVFPFHGFYIISLDLIGVTEWEQLNNCQGLDFVRLRWGRGINLTSPPSPPTMPSTLSTTSPTRLWHRVFMCWSVEVLRCIHHCLTPRLFRFQLFQPHTAANTLSYALAPTPPNTGQHCCLHFLHTFLHTALSCIHLLVVLLPCVISFHTPNPSSKIILFLKELCQRNWTFLIWAVNIMKSVVREGNLGNDRKKPSNI